MNPAHITYAVTGEPAISLITRLWEQRDGGKLKEGKKTGSKREETLWQNRPDATEELVIGVEDIPESIEDEMPAWRIMDYFNLTPELQFAPRPGGEGAVTG